MPAIFGNAHAFIILYGLAALKPLSNLCLIGLVVVWNDACNGLTNHLRSLVAKKAFCTWVPARDRAIEILADDCIFGEFDDGGEFGAILLGLILCLVETHALLPPDQTNAGPHAEQQGP